MLGMSLRAAVGTKVASQQTLEAGRTPVVGDAEEDTCYFDLGRPGGQHAQFLITYALFLCHLGIDLFLVHRSLLDALQNHVSSGLFLTFAHRSI